MNASVALVKPAYRTIPAFDRTLGPEVADLCRLAGFDPDPEQEMALDAIFATDRRGLSAAFETAVIACRQNMKALAVDTPLLTADGWRTMGSARVGDEVFHPDGHLVTVTGVSDVKRDHVCYRVETTDGRSVIADAGHLWTVNDRRKRAVRVLTTQQMLDEGLARGSTRTVVTDGKQYRTAEFRFQLPRQHALKSPDADLPIDPYLLGAWLGDGTAKGARIASHGDDVPHWIAEIRRCGFVPTVSVERSCMMVGITAEPGVGRQGRSFVGALRRLGVLSNKHVPDGYLRGSEEQREALLQGLMDTDGTIHHRSGQCTFTSTCQALADATLFVVRSLGWRATLTQGRALLRGRDCGPKYTVTFTPKSCDAWSPFRLARKASRVQAADGGHGRFTVSIKSIERVQSVPVRCIKVAAADGLFLAGRDLLPTHNTGVFKMAALGWLFLTDERLVVWSAHEFATAQEAFRDMTELIQGCSYLAKRLKATAMSDGIHRGRGEESIELLGNRRLVFKTRTKSGGRGLTGDKVILDEGFALQPMHMGALLPTLSARPDPQVVYGSSAGLPESVVLQGVRDRGRAGDPRLAYLEWCAPDPETACADGDRCSHALGAEGCGCDNPELWQRANPAMGRRITVDYIAAERRALPPAEFGRERMGWWDDPLGASIAIPIDSWRDLADPASTVDDPVVFAVDATPDRAYVSIGVAGRRNDGLTHLELLDHRRGTGWVAARLVELADRHRPIAIVIDPGSPAGSLIADVEASGVEVLKPTARDSAAACGQLVDAIGAGGVRHMDDPRLNAAVEVGAKKDLGEGLWRWTRTASTADISPLVAVTLAAWGFALKIHEHQDYDVLKSVW